MQVLMLIRVDAGLATEDLGGGVEAADPGAPVLGVQVGGADRAVVVRVRGGRTERASDGGSEGAERLVGLELREAPDLEAALDAAARHPAAAAGSIEVRPVLDEFLPPGATGLPEPREPGEEFLLLHRADPGGDTAAPAPDLPEWVRDVEERGVTLGGARLADAGAVVRRRRGEVLVARGPYAELAEEIGGVDLLRAADLDEAVAIAAAHPTARRGAIEVRSLGPR